MLKTEVLKRMSLDIDAVIVEMLEAIKSVSGNDWHRLRGAMLRTLKLRKAQFNYLAALRANNEISGDYLLNMLEEEKEIMMADIHAEVMIAKDTLNEALRVAMKVLEKAIEQIL